MDLADSGRRYGTGKNGSVIALLLDEAQKNPGKPFSDCLSGFSGVQLEMKSTGLHRS